MHARPLPINALILGLITAMGPFAIDMYLPALPSLGTSFGVDGKVVMLTLTAYFVSFGICQFLFGTVSDMFGRRGPLLAGLLLFVAASAGCAVAPSVGWLIGLRFLQGIGGAAGIVVTRAVVHDLYSGIEEIKMMSLLMLVFSVSPLLAPLAGSFIVADLGWRAVFWTIGGLGLCGIALEMLCVGETLPHERRIKPNWAAMRSAFAALARDRAFVGMTLIGAFGITSFFLYLGNSTFVMAQHYGLSPRGYSLAFSANAAAFFAAAQLNPLLSKRFGMNRIVLPAVMGFAACILGLSALIAAGIDGLPILSALLFVGFGFLGLVIPNVSVLGLENHGDIAGTAASVMNTFQLLLGSAAIGVSGLFVDGTPLHMMIGIAGAAVLTLFSALWTFSDRKLVTV